MPRIFDNIDLPLLPALQGTLDLSRRADFCVGYFNLRGWKALASGVDQWAGGPERCCRLLVGMQRPPTQTLRDALRVPQRDDLMDNQSALRLKKELASEFRDQLTVGIPTNEDEAGLRQLAAQIKARKLVVRLFLRHPLHAKLYLLHRNDPINPIVGYLGSSNLTMSGLSKQGELNVDVLDADASKKLAKWFEDRWGDKWCVDISDELVQIIEESWAREEALPPYHIYLKTVYHLSREARAGVSEFRIPSVFGSRLFEFQVAAIQIAAHHLNKRGGVLIGDVVGLGKTLMATAVARIFEDDHGIEALILCPKNIVSMWKDYRQRYGLRGAVLSTSRAIKKLPDMRRYRLVVIDESHNFRNRDGKTYQAIRDYIERNDSRVVLLSATPYNKTYTDLGSQLRLFVEEDVHLGIRPERFIREIGVPEFVRRHQCPVDSLAAFEKSEHPDDWRELMRLYMVRRTRTFIKENYADTDPANGRKYLTFEDGGRSYFPTRVPKTLRFRVSAKDKADQFVRLFASDVVNTINSLSLPRYGMANYVAPSPHEPPTASEGKVLDDLSRAGRRLMGFCRTNLFKRLESSGHAFLLSVRRHILRNYVYLHAIENDKPIPLGTQDVAMLDSRLDDSDEEHAGGLFEEEEESGGEVGISEDAVLGDEDYGRIASDVYGVYEKQFKRRFRWLRPDLFAEDLGNDLAGDARLLMSILDKAGTWDPERDRKLKALVDLLEKKHPDDKVIVFSQFADTVHYLAKQLDARGMPRSAGVTGGSADPTALAWRFSPRSNEKADRISPDHELRVVVATDVLSEGQNLQDCHIVVNYDLPWAIIRLVQRVGRVDRIGQTAEEILCYTFLPAEGVERIIRLRARIRQRLHANAEVVGTDEMFFEDDRRDQAVRDLFTEKAGILDGDDDAEVDLASYAYQIWKNAISEKPELERAIPDLPNVVYSAKPHHAVEGMPTGAIVYVKTAAGNDALAWVADDGSIVTESQLAVLRAMECDADTPAVPKGDQHHELVQRGVEYIAEGEKVAGGQLGRPSGARYKAYTRLKRYMDEVKGTLFETIVDHNQLRRAIEEIYRYPLIQSARDALNRQLRSGVSDDDLARLVVALREDGRLCRIEKETEEGQQQVICSLGLRPE